MRTERLLSFLITAAALVFALLMLLAAPPDSRAQTVAPQPPSGALSGVITVKSLPVKVTLQMNGSIDSQVEYGPTLSCGLVLEYVTRTSDGFTYAFKPQRGGSAGMAPYCNRLLGGRAWLRATESGFSYAPFDDKGVALEAADVTPVAAGR